MVIIVTPWYSKLVFTMVLLKKVSIIKKNYGYYRKLMVNFHKGSNSGKSIANTFQR